MFLSFKLFVFVCLFVCLFVWWCLTLFSTIFQLYRGGQFYWWRKLEDLEKIAYLYSWLTHSLTQIIDLRQVPSTHFTPKCLSQTGTTHSEHSTPWSNGLFLDEDLKRHTTCQNKWHPINWFNHTTYLCLSKTRTWISNAICLIVLFLSNDLIGPFSIGEFHWFKHFLWLPFILLHI